MDKSEVLDSPDQIKKIDRANALAAAAGTPEMLLEAHELARAVALPKNRRFKQVVVAGMGGSAISGDIAADLLAPSAPAPLYVNRGYNLPAFVAKDSLIFALSYSGNTEETLSAVKQAAERGAKIICVTSGGKLKEIAEKSSYPLYLVPSGYQPRAALPFLLLPLLQGLETFRFFSGLRQNLEESVTVLKKLRNDYGESKPARGNPAKQLAKKLLGKIPVIFGHVDTSRSAAVRFKTQLNENSKVTALCNFFPELNHNEIVNLHALKRGQHDFSLVFFRDDADPERVKKRIEITKSLIGSQLGGVHEANAQGKGRLAKILSLIFFGDLVSVYLALLQGIDPSEVEVITRLKKELGR